MSIKNNDLINLNLGNIIRDIDYSLNHKNFDENLFKLLQFNNLIFKNRFCFVGYSDDNFIDKNYKINDDYYDFYNKITKSELGCIITGGFSLDKVFDNINNLTLFIQQNNDKIVNLINEIHSAGSKIFFTIKSEYGRADFENQFCNITTYSASFNKNLFDSKFYCMRISDGQCSETIDKMSKLVNFAYTCKFDGIMIDGDLYGLVGEMSSPEINRRMFGYYSSYDDFSTKLLNKIKEIDKNINIFYTFSIQTYIEELYGKSYKNILSSSKFKVNFDINIIYKFITNLVKNGVDGFIIKLGTYETEFLSSPTEYIKNNFIKNIYIKIYKHLKENNIKNKFGKEVCLIYNDNYNEISDLLCLNQNSLINITNQILADYDYLYKIKNNLMYKNCIRCGYCSDRFSRKYSTSCAINPRYGFSKAVCKKEKIAIIGGGISGINSALYLAKLGYNVEIFEKNNVLNKNNRLREVFSYNVLLKKYNDYLDKKINYWKEKGKINVNLNTKFDTKMQNINKYSTIIVATGYKEKNSNIQGAVLKNVKNIYDVLENPNIFENLKNITINAKSELSLSLAHYLLLKKKKVSVIISDINFLIKMKNSKLTYYLYAFNKLKCKVYLFSKIKRIEIDFIEIFINSKIEKKNFVEVILNLKSGIKYKVEKKAKSFDLDLFIDEPDKVPNNKIYYDLVTSNFSGKIFMIGNALKLSDIGESIKSALFVSKNI